MIYNPFKKQLHEITEADLTDLISGGITEGWYIEYKSDIPKSGGGNFDSLKIAKSVAAFANTKGGWIIWGMSCDQKNQPQEITGVNLSAYPNFEDQVAKIINANISPRPYYHFKTVELANGHTAFVIQVEQSPTPPYITSQGVIYQREYNESKPIKERYIIEKLNERAEEYYESIERFTEFDLPETKGQADWNTTYLELYLFPLPFGSFNFENFYSSDFFKGVALRYYQSIDVHVDLGERKRRIPLNLGFNSIYSSERSLIIRPLTEKNLIYKSTTVELTDQGNLKVLLPLFQFGCDNIPDHYKDSNTLKYLLDKYSPNETIRSSYAYPLYSSRSDDSWITRRKETDFVRNIRFIDGVELIFSILILFSQYRAVLSDNKFEMTSEIGFRARITDCWRKFVFFDNDDYLEKIKLYNIPLAPKNEIEIPEFRKGNRYAVKLEENMAYLDIARFILEGIGLPDSESINFKDILSNGFDRFEESNDSQ